VTAGLQVSSVAAGTWAVSDSRTRVTFTVGHLRGAVTGSVAVSRGELVVAAGGAPVRARADLDLGTVDTGIARRDADLRSPRFLDTDRHPTMTWSADRFTRGERDEWTADGVLSLRGTSTPLEVRATPEPVTADENRLRIRGTAVLDRRAVGIRFPAVLIGHSVRIDVDAWLARVHHG
jgi:polyisoprenoid-binding protein YceI